jgi:hypothetical protein
MDVNVCACVWTGKGNGSFMTSAHVDFQNAKFYASRNKSTSHQRGSGTDAMSLLMLELQKTLSRVGSKVRTYMVVV